MGLDAVELVMEVEEHFDISIPDDQAGDIRTLGDLYGVIVEQIGGSPSLKAGYYDASHDLAFQCLKEDLVNRLGIDPEKIEPDRSLNELIPYEGRRRQWKKLRRGVNRKTGRKSDYPSLEFSPRWWERYFFGVQILLFLFVGSIAFLILRDFLGEDFAALPVVRDFGKVVGWTIAVFLAFLIGVPLIGNFLFFGFKRSFPASLRPPTVGALASRLLWLNRETILEGLDPPEPESDAEDLFATRDVCEALQAKAKAAFYEELAVVLERESETIGDEEPIGEVFSGRGWGGRLERFYEQTKLVLPSRVYPRWSRLLVMVGVVTTLGALLLLVAWFTSLPNKSQNWFIDAMGITACFWMLVSAFATLGFIAFQKLLLHQRVSEKFATVGELADWVAEKNYRKFFEKWKQENDLASVAEAGGYDSNEIWRDLCWIVVNVLDVDEEKLKPETKFAELF